MKKLGGNFIKKNIAVFISGRGSNLKSIIHHSKKKILHMKLKLLFQIRKVQKD